MTRQSSAHIESKPGIRSGKPCIAGTRISVSDVVIWTEQGKSPDEIVTDYPQLSLTQVHSALAYYYSHQAVIDEQIRDSESFVMHQKQARTGSSRLGKEDDGDTVSS